MSTRRARPFDQLLPMTYRWAETLPGALKPTHLMQTYPRIANRIAGVWADRHETLDALDEFLVDRRGGRRGFPPFVLAELLWLRDLAAQRSKVRGHDSRAADHGQRQPREEGASQGHSGGASPHRTVPRARGDAPDR